MSPAVVGGRRPRPAARQPQQTPCEAPLALTSPEPFQRFEGIKRMFGTFGMTHTEDGVSGRIMLAQPDGASPISTQEEAPE